MKRIVETQFEIDDSKALTIARRLFDDFYGAKGFFRNKPMPEYVLPRNLKQGTKEHALNLTYVVSIDYMVDAEIWLTRPLFLRN